MRRLAKKLKNIWTHPANAGHQWQTLGRIVYWQLCKRLAPKPMDFPVFNSPFRIRVYPDGEAAPVAVYYGGSRQYFYDYHEMGFMAGYLQPGQRFLDVGTNIGIYTLFALSRVGVHGHVDAIEANPRTAVRLRENLVLNNVENLVTLFETAVGEHPHIVLFSTVQGGTDHVLKPEEAGQADAVEVPCVRLDTLLAGYQYAMGKMDIEGFELDALRGAAGLLANANPPVWQIEVNDCLGRYGHTPEELGAFLASYGYQLAIYDVFSGELTWTETPWRYRQNILAIHTSATSMVCQRLTALRENQE